MDYRVRVRFTLHFMQYNNCNCTYSIVIISIYFAVYCKVHKAEANFTSFPCNSLDKAHAIFKLYLGVRSQLKKWTILAMCHCSASRP